MQYGELHCVLQSCLCESGCIMTFSLVVVVTQMFDNEEVIMQRFLEFESAVLHPSRLGAVQFLSDAPLRHSADKITASALHCGRATRYSTHFLFHSLAALLETPSLCFH